MRRIRIAVVLATVAMVVVGLAGPAAAKTVSPKKYAKSLCGTLGDIGDANEQLATDFGTIPGDDSAAFQTQIIDLANGFVAELEAAESKLKKLIPDVEGGKKVSKLFVESLDEQASATQAAIDTFAAADPNGVAFQADVSTFGVALDTVTLTLGDPFSEVTNQDLLEAFDEESSCEEIVTVF